MPVIFNGDFIDNTRKYLCLHFIDQNLVACPELATADAGDGDLYYKQSCTQQ